MTGHRLRVVAIADADSYVKWAGALLDAEPHADAHILIVRTPVTVSVEQEHTALAGTRFGSAEVTRVDYDGIAPWLAADRPDVVVLAGRGPFIRIVMAQIDRVLPRPVVVSGPPGISIPAQRGALVYRREVDLVLVHSHRERRAFEELAGRVAVDTRLALATLPFAHREERPSRGTDLVFAAQAVVPTGLSQRAALADILRRAALADPDRRVVVKLRSRPGERETHFERESFESLLQERPKNLVFSYQPMSAALARAEGLVTVSSTAAIEAIARGVAVIALDTFGISKPNLNTVFRGSGLLGTADDVVARRFRHPEPGWLADNYFHDAADDDWWTHVEELVARRRAGELPERRQPHRRGGFMRAAWQRKSVLGYVDRTLTGTVALAIGMPLRAAALAVTSRTQSATGALSWADAESDITLTPTPHQEPMTLRRPVGAAH